MFVFRAGYTAQTGPRVFQLPYQCARCGAATTASVLSQGHGRSVGPYGIGASASTAHQRAEEAAGAHARSALRSAACPRCHMLQPAVEQAFEEARRSAVRRRSFALPSAAAAAVLLGLALAVPAARDLSHAPWLAVASSGIVVCAAATVLSALLWPRRAPRLHADGVSFWSAQPNGVAAWIPAPPPLFPPAAPPTSGFAQILALVVAAPSGVVAMIALALWSSTFSKVYVVDAAPSTTTIRLDGSAVDAKPDARFADATVRVVTVRTDTAHRVAIDDGDGRAQAYVVPPNRHGWVIARRAADHGLCVVEENHVYGDAITQHALTRLNATTDSFGLPRDYEDVFSAPPSTVSATEHGQTGATRWTLRAVSCSSLMDHKLVPYRPTQPAHVSQR